MMTLDNRPAALSVSRRTHSNKRVRWETIVGWLFVLPALFMYAVFVLVPLLLSILYSFNRWNGVGPMTWVGLNNYVTVFQFPNLIGSIFNAFWLIVWFSFIPVGLGLVTASVINRVATGRFGEIARTVLFLPYVIALVAAGIIWGWLFSLSGLVNQILEAIGLGAITRAWLGDFNSASVPSCCRPPYRRLTRLSMSRRGLTAPTGSRSSSRSLSHFSNTRSASA
jgi:raffinose/stachyose/melibiose transport system permease protein